MEGRYYKFYQSPFDRNSYPAQTLDIDQILRGYLESPAYQLQSKNTATFDTAHTTFVTDESNKEEKKQICSHLSSISQKSRRINQIDISVNLILQKAQADRSCNDTLNLSRYFHQQISFYLNQLNQCRILTKEEWLEAEKYFKQPRTFKTNVQLFKSSKIRRKCLQYIESPNFISKLFLSTKMKFSRKTAILKYVQRLCQCIKLTQDEREEEQLPGKISSWKK